MAPVVQRFLRVTYGAFVVGGTQDNRRLDAGPDGLEPYSVAVDRERTRVTFRVLLAGYANDDVGGAAFNVDVAATEAAFRLPRQRLLIEQLDTAGAALVPPLVDLDPTTDTGIQVRASIRKDGSEHDTARSRLYRVEITAFNPANQAVTAGQGQEGLRDFSWTVMFLPSRARQLTLRGVYTRLGAVNAFAQFQAEIADLANEIQNFLGAGPSGLAGKWDLVSENIDPDNDLTAVDVSNPGLVRFTQTYEEVNLQQSLAQPLDDPDIRRQRLDVQVGLNAPGDTGRTVSRLAPISVSYSASVDLTSASVDPQNLRLFYTSRIRPWLLQYAQDVAGSTTVALVDESPTFRAQTGEITVNMILLAAFGGNVIQRLVTTEDDDEKGVRIVYAWLDDPLAAYVFQGARVFNRTTVETKRVLGTITPPQGCGGAAGGGGAASRGAGARTQRGFRGGTAPGVITGVNLQALDVTRGGQINRGAGAPGRVVGAGGDEPAVGGGGGGGAQAGSPTFVVRREVQRISNSTLGIPATIYGPALQLDVTDIETRTLLTCVAPISAAPGGGGGGGGGDQRPSHPRRQPA